MAEPDRELIFLRLPAAPRALFVGWFHEANASADAVFARLNAAIPAVRVRTHSAFVLATNVGIFLRKTDKSYSAGDILAEAAERLRGPAGSAEIWVFPDRGEISGRERPALRAWLERAFRDAILRGWHEGNALAKAAMDRGRVAEGPPGPREWTDLDIRRAPKNLAVRRLCLALEKSPPPETVEGFGCTPGMFLAAVVGLRREPNSPLELAAERAPHLALEMLDAGANPEVRDSRLLYAASCEPFLWLPDAHRDFWAAKLRVFDRLLRLGLDPDAPVRGGFHLAGLPRAHSLLAYLIGRGNAGLPFLARLYADPDFRGQVWPGPIPASEHAWWMKRDATAATLRAWEGWGGARRAWVGAVARAAAARSPGRGRRPKRQRAGRK